MSDFGYEPIAIFSRPFFTTPSLFAIAHNGIPVRQENRAHKLAHRTPLTHRHQRNPRAREDRQAGRHRPARDPHGGPLRNPGGKRLRGRHTRPPGSTPTRRRTDAPEGPAGRRATRPEGIKEITDARAETRETVGLWTRGKSSHFSRPLFSQP